MSRDLPSVLEKMRALVAEMHQMVDRGEITDAALKVALRQHIIELEAILRGEGIRATEGDKPSVSD